MKSAIFLPEKMKVGFVKRDGTFNGQLAYIIYYDNKGKLRKEKSWESWRDKSIQPIDFDNEPTEGFVLNKKAGGYSTGWNHRSTYCRIYDPRGYEFEITIPNLLYILENTNSIKGKGLEGKFVYGIDGKDLILIPCDSPDYKRLKEFNDKVRQGIKFNMNNMIVGATYRDAKNRELVYVGRYDDHDRPKLKSGNLAKSYYFYDRNMDKPRWNDTGHNSHKFVTYSSVGTSIIECVDETCCLDYADIFDDFEYYESYNPYDCSKDEYIDFTLESFTRYANDELQKEMDKKYYPKNYTDIYYFVNNGESGYSHEKYDRIGTRRHIKYGKDSGFRFIIRTEKEYQRYSWSEIRKKFEYAEEEISLEEFFNRVSPQFKREYLLDGKLRREVCNGKHTY